MKVKDTCIDTFLSCSFSIGSESIVLNAPNKGNSDNYDLGRLNKRTRGGELIQFRDPIWPQKNVLNLDIPMYSCIDVLNSRSFFKRHLGKIMVYQDHEDFIYHGIVSNVFEIEEQNNVAFMMHIEFTSFLQGYT